MTQDNERKLALGEELLTSMRLITAGLGQLQSLDGTNDFYHLPILSLANGFERFMKVTLCFDKLEKSGAFPDPDFLPPIRHGHNLEILRNRVTTECFHDQYISRVPVAKQDRKYLRSRELRDFVSILSEFGQKARYHDLDIVVGRSRSGDSPVSKWHALNMEILIDNGWLEESVANPATTQVVSKVNRQVIMKMERFARALSRLYTIGGLGSEAKRYSSYLKPYLFLMESDLGEQAYSASGNINGSVRTQHSLRD